MGAYAYLGQVLSWPRVRYALCLAPLLTMFACRATHSAEIERVPDELPTPGTADVGVDCVDVADVRACWPLPVRERGEQDPERVARILPKSPAPEAGFRCYGAGSDRKCVDRARNSGPFACSDGACRQAFPRLPTDGEWECAETDGIVYCHGSERAAGVATAADDPGWICGLRGGPEAKPGERVCVDYAPDAPPGSGAVWACQFEYVTKGTRRCIPSRERRAGSVCSPTSTCPPAMTCARGRCVPRAFPAPSCWFDTDCAPGLRCHYGTCASEAP